MSENITPTSELDLDDWLATGKRTTHNVNLFARFDLLAEIDALEAQKVPSILTPDAEQSLGGEADPNAEIKAQIEALEAKIWESKKVFRASNINQDEIDSIREEVLKECKDEIDKASAFGKSEALNTCKRMDIKDPADINAMVRIGVKEFADKVINRETTLRMIQKSVTTQNKAGDWVSLSLEQIKSLHAKLGEQQIDVLANAVYKANNDAPEVTVPKS